MLLVDTGVFLSAADRDEPSHSRCAELLQRHRGHIITAAPVIAETSWMIESRLGVDAEMVFLTAVTEGMIEVVDLTSASYRRCVELIGTYSDLGLGLVDASLVVTAELLAVKTIATLNHRDFAVVRPAHVDAFELVPGAGHGTP